MRGSKRMMFGFPAIFILIKFEQRKIRNPDKDKILFILTQVRLIGIIVFHCLGITHPPKRNF